MLAFLRQRSDVYTWSGIAFVVMGVALVVAVLAVWDLLGREPGAVVLRAAAVLGLFAIYIGAGVVGVPVWFVGLFGAAALDTA